MTRPEPARRLQIVEGSEAERADPSPNHANRVNIEAVSDAALPIDTSHVAPVAPAPDSATPLGPAPASSPPTPAASLQRRIARRVRQLAVSASRRVLGTNRQQTLRRTPILIAVLVAALSAPMFNRLYRQVVKEREQAVWNDIRTRAYDRTSKAQTKLAGGADYQDGMMFLVKPGDQYKEAFGETDLEPPVFQFAAAAEGGPAEEWFQQRGRSMQTYTRKISADTFLVAIEDVTWLDGYLRSKRSGLWRWSILGWLTTGALAGLAAHLALRPARRMLRERTDFLADAAHELRTPLAVIQASAGHALSRERDTVDYVQSLAEIRGAAERASAGVTELLDLARFDAGQAMPRLAPLRLDLLAEELAAATRVEGTTLTTEVGPSVLVQADMALLRQALDNVVRNAAARADQVLLRCGVDGTDGVLHVIDDGPGFAAEQLPYVFERYRRGDGRGSLGLGLPIAASIVAAHGGQIEIASPSPRALSAERPGSMVTIRLPRSRA
jgi:signal transduction histidine kinase